MALMYKMNSENTSYVHHSIVGHGYPLGFYFGSPLSNNISTHIKVQWQWVMIIYVLVHAK